MMLNDLCPVCGMEPETDVPNVVYHKMYFHFCSEQCREMFTARPTLYTPHIGKQQEAVLKQRTLHLAEEPGNDVTDRITSSLQSMMGVKGVVIEGRNIVVTYDLLQVTERQIEKVLIEVGIELGGDWLARLQRGWVHDSEEIELDNLATPPVIGYNRIPPKN